MKLIWFGDLAPTGFGTVTTDTGRELINMGVDVRFASMNELPELPEMFRPRTLDATSVIHSAEESGYAGIQPFVSNLLLGTAQDLPLVSGDKWGDWKPDVCFLLGDFYGMRDFVEEHLAAFKTLPTFHYVPIEGHDLPPLWNEVWSVIKPIAMTEFGQDQIEQVIGYRPPMVYHGVDTEAFYPVSPSHPIVLTDGEERVVLTSKAACKYFLTGDASMTLILRTDRYMPRKGYSALLRAMAPVMRERPNVRLALHCRQRDYGGYLPDDLSKFPDVRDRVMMRSHGAVPREILLTLYNAADVYVSTSAEGFGLTIAEAIACGVPAVGLDYSAVPEVIGPAGTLVPVGRLLDNEYAHHWALPDEAAFGRAVGYLIDHPHRRLELGRMGPNHVSKNFRWDVAAERFVHIAEQALMGNVTPFPQMEVAA